ncbi:SDR family NAD(P)-dependent oxidoreductase [Nitrosomonas eutropha]|uniref:NAD(P)-dependent dehydrogenase (Short-subunit alcohol dehydrogenase family) n=3 Tax=Nitrosomonas eutropha TaxID=916 RepID=A0ABX5MCZ1_9PROT|nr:SDR family oxidoreductase [Nitrosomonas eutropha]ABI59142.1 short-chain dehydrogenase/reductase SDR [Nitrosomonas eutropha C91]PXV83886.1 NAD(P)-dependent dehydrogenase (short-subunit alcohol dehydrogenase family) [Nitrosomonas eutropha]SCX06405.1 NAD(P)-dependent dehydrogenase, short-chain alcohol dehydrogenase family [Nitrosomonas eutropha]SDX15232.1 NAD(P)-dependent dehydrogenase, short-chain alcohol dehydrogenase family [Nitrosomonas eutropha]
MNNLENQVIIVTGGAAGIGAAITTVLTQRGASVVVVDINEAAGTAIAQSNPGQIVFLKGDVSSESVAKQAVELAIARFGKLTGLVNNAHASTQKPLIELSKEDWALSFGTGFNATLYFMKAAYPELTKSGGSIVNFGSGAALLGLEQQASYTAAKEAIRGLSRVAANEWAKDNIRVNVVSPKALTEGVAHWKAEYPEQYAASASNIPLQRFGDPQKDVAPVVAFLLSEDSRYMTGQTLMADGGSIQLR